MGLRRMSLVARVLAEDCQGHRCRSLTLSARRLRATRLRTIDAHGPSTVDIDTNSAKMPKPKQPHTSPSLPSQIPSPANRDTADGNEIKNSVKVKVGVGRLVSERFLHPHASGSCRSCGSPQVANHWALGLSRPQQATILGRSRVIAVAYDRCVSILHL